MAMFTVWESFMGGDFKCPECKQSMEIGEWNTEYGGCEGGQWPVVCIKCRHEFEIHVYTKVICTVVKDSH